MKTRLFMILLVPAFFLSAPAFAQHSGGPTGPIDVPVESADSERLELLLGTFHELPPKAQFESVPGVRSKLDSMAKDGTSPRLQKRAIEALAYWPDAATLATYESVLADVQTRMGTRHMTLLLVGIVFKVDGVELLEPYLAADDLQLRLTAVDAIAATQSDKGFELLSKRAKVETSAVVLERIEKMGSRVR